MPGEFQVSWLPHALGMLHVCFLHRWKTPGVFLAAAQGSAWTLTIPAPWDWEFLGNLHTNEPSGGKNWNNPAGTTWKDLLPKPWGWKAEGEAGRWELQAGLFQEVSLGLCNGVGAWPGHQSTSAMQIQYSRRSEPQLGVKAAGSCSSRLWSF